MELSTWAHTREATPKLPGRSTALEDDGYRTEREDDNHNDRAGRR